ncbi:TIGR01212 family radical SAM protein, partial [Klebsiella pneumoniae]
MQLQKLVNMFGGDLMRRYGEKVHKLTLHGGFSCPNRDGTLGRGGCTFCNVASFADEAQQHRSIAEQLAHQAQLVNRAKRYLAYFQAYTSTFAEVQVLRSMYRQAVSAANIVGLCVGTRPDCVPQASVVVKFFWTRRSDGRVMHRRATGRQGWPAFRTV